MPNRVFDNFELVRSRPWFRRLGELCFGRFGEVNDQIGTRFKDDRPHRVNGNTVHHPRRLESVAIGSPFQCRRRKYPILPFLFRDLVVDPKLGVRCGKLYLDGCFGHLPARSFWESLASALQTKLLQPGLGARIQNVTVQSVRRQGGRSGAERLAWIRERGTPQSAGTKWGRSPGSCRRVVRPPLLVAGRRLAPRRNDRHRCDYPANRDWELFHRWQSVLIGGAAISAGRNRQLIGFIIRARETPRKDQHSPSRLQGAWPAKQSYRSAFSPSGRTHLDRGVL